MIKGYIAKSLFDGRLKGLTNYDDMTFYKSKGKKIDWHEDDWPPEEVFILTTKEYHDLLKEHNPFPDVITKLLNGKNK